jgi:hypothetical protein
MALVTRLAVLLLLALLLGLAPHAAAQDAAVSEAQVKAVFLFKFAGYVEWPEAAFGGPGAPFVIGVLDSEPVARELRSIVASRHVAGRPVEVRALRADEAPNGLHVLFVGHAAGDDLRRVLAPLRGRPTLVVTETEHALAAGSTINFVLVGGKVRFDIAPPAPADGRLRISSRLLAVARQVEPPR